MQTTVGSDEKGKGWRDHCLPPTICAVLGHSKDHPMKRGYRLGLIWERRQRRKRTEMATRAQCGTFTPAGTGLGNLREETRRRSGPRPDIRQSITMTDARRGWLDCCTIFLILRPSEL
jgi:hypothetical protein